MKRDSQRYLSHIHNFFKLNFYHKHRSLVSLLQPKKVTVAEKHNLVSQRVFLVDFSSDMYETNNKFKQLGTESEKHTITVGKSAHRDASSFYSSPNIISTMKYSVTPFIRINWESQPSGYAENADN